jgi:hypothetical protein
MIKFGSGLTQLAKLTGRVGIAVGSSHLHFLPAAPRLGHVPSALVTSSDLAQKKPPQGFYPVLPMATSGFVVEAKLSSGRDVVVVTVPPPLWWTYDNRLDAVRVLRARVKSLFKLAQKAKLSHLVLDDWAHNLTGIPSGEYRIALRQALSDIKFDGQCHAYTINHRNVVHVNV